MPPMSVVRMRPGDKNRYMTGTTVGPFIESQNPEEKA